MQNKRIDILLLCVLLLGLAVGCNVPEPEPVEPVTPQDSTQVEPGDTTAVTPPVVPADTVPYDTLMLRWQTVDPLVAWPAGGEAKVLLTSPMVWTLASDQDWLTVERSSGAPGAFEVTVRSSAQTEAGQDRDATLTLTTDSGFVQLEVRQHANIFRRTYLKTRNVSQSYTWLYPSTATLTKTVSFLTYPETNEYQVIHDSDYGSAKVGTTKEGVRYLYDVRTSAFPASGDPTILHTFTIDLYLTETDFDKITEPDLPYDTESEAYKRYTSKYTSPTGFQVVDPTHPWVVSTADELWLQCGGNRVEYARLCYEKVSSALTYGMYSGNNSIDEILARMSGDCGNQHAVWISLMRAKGVPARPIAMNSPEGFAHVRGEFYLAGYGWIPLDVTYHQNGPDYFGKFTDDNLIVMNRDFSITLSAGGEQPYCTVLQGGFGYYWFWGSGEVSGRDELGYKWDDEDTWSISGTMNNWALQNTIPMTHEGDWWVARDVSINSDKFKFVWNHSWAKNRGGLFAGFGKAVSVTQNGPDIEMSNWICICDIYLNDAGTIAYVVRAGTAHPAGD